MRSPIMDCLEGLISYEEACKRLSPYDKLFQEQEEPVKRTITRIDVLASNPPAVFIERDVKIDDMRMYYPTRASWKRLARVLNDLRNVSAWYIRANSSQPGLVAEQIVEPPY